MVTTTAECKSIGAGTRSAAANVAVRIGPDRRVIPPRRASGVSRGNGR
jgi:hypothetical protein